MQKENQLDEWVKNLNSRINIIEEDINELDEISDQCDYIEELTSFHTKKIQNIEQELMFIKSILNLLIQTVTKLTKKEKEIR